MATEHDAAMRPDVIWAFRITGTVEAASMDEAIAAIRDYCDAASDDDPTFEERTPIGDMLFEWQENPSPDFGWPA